MAVKTGDIIEFYNSVFVTTAKSMLHALRTKSVNVHTPPGTVLATSLW